MFAETFDIGPNLLQVLVPLATALALYVTNRNAKKATEVAAETHKQLQPNGGSSAFDKLSKQNAEILDGIDTLTARVEALEIRNTVKDAAP